jgi:hypothetical protein
MRQRLKKKNRISETKSWLFENINKSDKSLAKLTQRKRERPKLIKLEMRKAISSKTPMKFRGSLGNASKTYILIN